MKVLLLTLISLWILVGAETEERDLRTIIQSGVLKVAIWHQDIYPFFMHNKEGKFTGHDVDMALDIGEKLGVKVEFDKSATSFNGMVDLVAEKKVDVVISLLSSTIDRAKKVLFTDPYVVLNVGMFANRMAITRLKHENDEHWFKALIKSDEIIATRRGTAYEEYARKTFPNATIKTYVEWNDVVDAVIKGEAACLFYDEIEIKKLVRLKPDLAIKGKTVVIKDQTDPLAMAVSVDHVHLWSWLNYYLKQKKPVTADILLDQYEKDLP